MARIQNILANNNQRSNKKEIHQGIRYSSTSKKKTPQHKSTKNQSEVLKFEDDLIKQHNNDTSPSMRCSRNNRMTGKKLYEANHLCMMKLALIKNKLQKKKTTTSRYHSSIVKTTSHIKTRRKVPNFAARWRAI